ncbi:hypothetical protein ACQP00_37995 [Dactylosporangium sp. CS-047395]|uniref:hypothetical protein n=1 Tax=Dactylosporangium sp. CS-047395 TaxID=3239936 RepID=UPI003D8DF0A3
MTEQPDQPVQPEPTRKIGRARLGRAVGKAPLPERAPTTVMRDAAQPPPPVFVDPSGARRKRLRRIVYLLGLLLLAALLALWLSQFLGSTRPPAERCPAATATPAACR